MAARQRNGSVIRLAAHLTRGWCRIWLTGPLRAAELLHLARVGDIDLVLIRPRRSPRG
jgi:hypothetical protein